ncbi:MAG: hypothetical protein WCO53_12390 [Deltaproteobacteria bacterium]
MIANSYGTQATTQMMPVMDANNATMPKASGAQSLVSMGQQVLRLLVRRQCRISASANH